MYNVNLEFWMDLDVACGNHLFLTDTVIAVWFQIHLNNSFRISLKKNIEIKSWLRDISVVYTMFHSIHLDNKSFGWIYHTF